MIAKVGSPRTAFQGFGLGDDTPAPSANAGQFFLTDDGVVAGPPATLIITYSTPVAAAGGDILDIDGSEGYTVEAYNTGNALIDSVVLGPNNALDGSATHWSFSHGSADIAAIHIRYTGSQSGGIGLAFDNFSPSSAFAAIPEPAILALLGPALAALALAARRQPSTARTGLPSSQARMLATAPAKKPR